MPTLGDVTQALLRPRAPGAARLEPLPAEERSDGTSRCCETRDLEHALRRRHGGARRQLHAGRGRAALPDRPQRRRQEHLLQDAHRPASSRPAARCCSAASDISPAPSRTRSRASASASRPRCRACSTGLTRAREYLARGDAASMPRRERANARSTRCWSVSALPALAKRLVGQLAHGQRQWVETRHRAVDRSRPHPARRTRRRHDRMRRSTHRRTHPRDQSHQGAHRRRARHAVHPHDRQARSPCSIRARS